MPKVCIIIPCFNEESRMPVTEFNSYFERSDVCFCFVDDGSSDNTAGLLREIRNGREERILIIEHSKNKGKAEAIRTGIMHATSWQPFEFVGYWDADFSTPLKEIDHLLESFNNNINVAVGSRVQKLGSNIVRVPLRHYFGRVLATFASNILGLPVYDTQCGAKIMRSTIAVAVFDKSFISRWLFDIEIFARIVYKFGKKKTLETVIEVPLNEWIEKGGSKIKITYLFKIPFELLKINKAYKHSKIHNR